VGVDVGIDIHVYDDGDVVAVGLGFELGHRCGSHLDSQRNRDLRLEQEMPCRVSWLQ